MLDQLLRNHEFILAAIAIIISIIALVITSRSYRREEITSVMPVLVFVFDEISGWSLKNIGKGPAMRVMFALGDVKKDPIIWFDKTNIPPMASDGIYLLEWVAFDNINRFGVCYNDIYGRKYYTICSKDVNVTERGWHPDIVSASGEAAAWERMANS